MTNQIYLISRKDQDLVRVHYSDIIENLPKLTYLDYEMATVGASVAGTF